MGCLLRFIAEKSKFNIALFAFSSTSNLFKQYGIVGATSNVTQFGQIHHLDHSVYLFVSFGLFGDVAMILLIASSKMTAHNVQQSFVT